MTSPGYEDLSDIVDPTKIGTLKFKEVTHNNDCIRSLNASLPNFKKSESNLTETFFSSLKFDVPKDRIELKGLHIYGGPSCGKSTLAHKIGHYMKEYFGNRCQCIECQYFPDAIHHINPECDVIVISVDDPMGGGEEGGTQHARRSSSEDVQTAVEEYNAVRHIYRKRVLYHRARELYGSPVPEYVVDIIDRNFKDTGTLMKYLPKDLALVGGVLYVMWGPQLPTIDQTFHQNKEYEIYKGLSSMDEKRKAIIRSSISSFWLSKLGEKEKEWRRNIKPESKSWSVIKDVYTGDIGWLYAPPAPANVFKRADRGGKGFQEKVRTDTEKLDTWAQYIYENRNALMPPYDPFGKQEDRRRSLDTFITDMVKVNKDPRTFEELAPHVQIFMNKVKKNLMSLDNRIIRYHYSNMDETQLIEESANALALLLEEEGLSPHMKAGRQIVHDIARRKLEMNKQLIDKPGNFKKIYDHLLYLWFQMHPEESKRGMKKSGPDEEESEEYERASVRDEELLSGATVELEGNIIEFSLKEEDIIDAIVDENPEKMDQALIYMHTEGICGKEMMSNRDVYLFSQDAAHRERFGFPEKLTSVEAVKYRKKQFRGLMSVKMGRIFEDWVEQTLLDGSYIQGILENVSSVQHGGETGEPDFVLLHDDNSYTVLAAKCYASDRSETLEKAEISPEISYHNKLRQEGKRSRIMVIYQNIKIPHLLIVYTWENAAEIPANMTFPPTMSGHFYFRKQED